MCWHCKSDLERCMFDIFLFEWFWLQSLLFSLWVKVKHESKHSVWCGRILAFVTSHQIPEGILCCAQHCALPESCKQAYEGCMHWLMCEAWYMRWGLVQHQSFLLLYLSANFKKKDVPIYETKPSYMWKLMHIYKMLSR